MDDEKFSLPRTYAAIDLKSFYASVELADRHYDPLTTNLVVADQSRTDKTICLAVSPSLKAHGISGRARLFEVIQRVKEVNNERFRTARRLGVLPKDPETSIPLHLFLLRCRGSRRRSGLGTVLHRRSPSYEALRADQHADRVHLHEVCQRRG